MNIIDNNNSYTIPLDGIDLNYFTKEYIPNNEFPLWNINNQKPKQYYEFKIVAQKKEDSDDKTYESGDCVTNHSTYQCSVCNLNIPLAYKKQHINSPKHKTCLKILETAMDRARLCLTQAQDCNDIPKPASRSYFCEPCAITVINSKRKEHELSKEHFKSLMHDKFLNDLLMIYINKEHLEKIKLEYMSGENRNGTNSHHSDSDEYTSDSDEVEEHDDDDKQTDNFMNLMNYLNGNDSVKNESDGKIIDKVSIVDEVIKNTNVVQKNNAMNLIEYIKMLASHSHSSSSPNLIVKGDKVEMETADKTTLCVSEDNFHGWSRNSDNKIIYCKLCLVSVKDENEHKMSPEHITKVKTPILDMHGIRQGKVYQHCVLCNMQSVNIVEHKISDAHVETFRKALGSVITIHETPLVVNKKEKTYCQNCNIYIDTHNFVNHVQGKNHKLNANATDVAKNTANKTFCAPCNIYVETNNLTSHLNGQRHKNNTKDTNYNKNENSKAPPSKVTNDETRTYCTTCDLHVNIKENQSHVNTKAHKLKELAALNLEPFKFMYTTPTHNLCRVCDVKVPNHDSNVKEHVLGTVHTKNYATLLNSYNIKKINNHVVCGTCKLYIKVETILDHIEKKHKLVMRTKLCRICHVPVTDTPKAIEDHNNSIAHKNNLDEYRHSHLEINNDIAKCKVCEVHVDILESKHHLNSTSHMQKLETLLYENKVAKTDNLFICSVCSIVIEGDDWIDHIISDNTALHSVRLSQSNPHTYACIFCNVDVPISRKNIEIHENGRTHKSNFKNILKMVDFRNSSTHTIQIVHKGIIWEVDYL